MSSARDAFASSSAIAEDSARRSMRQDESVTAAAAAAAGAVFASVASEKRTLLSFRSPVNGVMLDGEYTSPLSTAGLTRKVSPHRLQRIFTVRPSMRSGSSEYRALQAGHVSFIVLVRRLKNRVGLRERFSKPMGYLVRPTP